VIDLTDFDHYCAAARQHPGPAAFAAYLTACATITARPPEDHMTPLATFEHELRTALDDTGEHIRSVLDHHLPDLAAAEGDPLAQAVATLTPQARGILADFVTSWVAAGTLATQPAAVNARDLPLASDVPGEPSAVAEPVPVADQLAAGVPASGTVTMASQRAGTPAPAAPVSDPAAVGDAAQPEAPAEVPLDASAGPVIAGVAS
jgi:hypothetical protein